MQMTELQEELKKYYGEDALFREGQEEAIENVLKGKRTLVVQKTGWGKSLVYFLATKILRKDRSGFTLIISPLLALMNNQIDSAARLSLQVRTINSENTDDWDRIFDELKEDRVDALIISPERLANGDFRLLLNSVASRIFLFVVDEAHCISDWGHDFRPDYRRIIEVIHRLPPTVPVLATTATANDRVIKDIQAQLGKDILISRGSLMRESLAIQVKKLDTKEERLAWIANNVPFMPGSGIVYCLTTADCRLVTRWLLENGIESESFYSNVDTVEGKNKEEIIRRFMNNEIKVLAATVAFGMGFDKPDIGFVIHFQKPGNIVAYYQQIGRAGRTIDRAYAILLCGREDDEINRYFIDSAFPTEDLMNDVVKAAQDHGGLTQREFEKYLNMAPGKIQACLKYLTVNGDIYKEGNRYYKSARPWSPDLEKCARITAIREEELRQMNAFTEYSGCFMHYIADALDDSTAADCGRCANCVGHPLFDQPVSAQDIARVQSFIRDDFQRIEPRKRWPTGFHDEDNRSVISPAYRCETGWVLSDYGDAGWGRMVSEGKYRDHYFNTELVEASFRLLKPFAESSKIRWVCCVPSLRRPELVRSFAVRLAERLGLPFADALKKTETGRQQKELNNSYLQCTNISSTLEADESQIRSDNVLLIDDMVDSRWTFTVCGYLLRKKGSGKVFPFALANTAGRSGQEG